MSLIDELALAIARYESGGNPNAISRRNNNPGNLRSWGSYPVVGGYAQFPDYATGLEALKQQVERNIGRGLSLNEFFAGKPGVYGGYAPARDSNSPSQYAGTVAGWLGIDPDTPLSRIGAPNPPTPQRKLPTGARATGGEDHPMPGRPRARG